MKHLSLFLIILLLFSSQSMGQKVIRKNIRQVIEPALNVTEEKTPPKEEPPTLSVEPPRETKSLSTNIPAIIKKDDPGLFGLRRNGNLSAFYLYNREGQTGILGLMGVRAAFTFDDPFAIGSRLNLSSDALEYELGTGLCWGQGYSNRDFFSLPLFANATLYLKEGSLFGMDPFIKTGLNLNVIGTDTRLLSGIGGELMAGVLVDIFNSPHGKSQLSIGYSSLKVADIRLSEGLTITFTQPLRF